MDYLQDLAIQMLLDLSEVTHETIECFRMIRIDLSKKRNDAMTDEVSLDRLFDIRRVGDKVDIPLLAVLEDSFFLDVKERAKDVIISLADPREASELRATNEIENEGLDRIIEVMRGEDIFCSIFFSDCLEKSVSLITSDFFESELL